VADSIVIVGDSLLDIDIDGAAERLSPDAPVPVIDTERVWHRPGGAGLAALLAARSADDVTLVTAVADDRDGRQLTGLLSSAGVRVVPLPMLGGTVCKTRVRARGQCVLRIDRGSGTAAPDEVPAEAADAIAHAAVICVADYGRGVTAHPGLRALLSAAAQRVPVVWDPHPRGSDPVRGCRLVTPNQAEAVGRSAASLRKDWQAAAVCVTCGAQGAVLDTEPLGTVQIPSLVGRVSGGDSCGAGDRFAVSVATELGNGQDVRSAVTTAVGVAGQFVAAGGAGAVSTPVTDVPDDGGEFEALTGDIETVRQRLRARATTVVAAGGCFDLLHTGHVRLLREARLLGDALVVLINSDRSVRALKGAGRPVMAAADRARVLSALACVDAVLVFDEDSPAQALARLRPDVWVKGGDYADAPLPEAEVVRRYGGEMVLLPTVAGYSSSNLIAAARS